MGRDMPCQKLPIPLGDRGPNPIYGFLRPSESTAQTASIELALVFNSQTHTDRPRYIDSNRPHLILCIPMRPKNDRLSNDVLSV